MSGTKAVTQLSEMISQSRNLVFFGGAGVSTESHIPDFRSASGLYHSESEAYAPEEMLHRDFFLHNTQVFFSYYFANLVYPHAVPNAAHQTLAEWEREGKVNAIITQNIDGLHQMAGSECVIELHGSVKRNFCITCGAAYTLEQMLAFPPELPRCTCGGIIKPDVVLYGESLSEATVTKAIACLKAADLLIVGGTSLSVYPAAGLIRYFQGGPLVLINRDETAYDAMAQLVIRENIGWVLDTCRKLRS